MIFPDRYYVFSLKCQTRNEFLKRFRGAYASAKKNGWIEEIYLNFEDIVRPRNYWTKEKCLKEALKYKTKKEFRVNSISAYNTSIKNGWIGEACSHMISKLRQKGYWTKEKCMEVAKNYKTRTSFRRDYSGAYKACRDNGWLDDIFNKFL